MDALQKTLKFLFPFPDNLNEKVRTNRCEYCWLMCWECARGNRFPCFYAKEMELNEPCHDTLSHSMISKSLQKMHYHCVGAFKLESRAKKLLAQEPFDNGANIKQTFPSNHVTLLLYFRSL